MPSLTKVELDKLHRSPLTTGKLFATKRASTNAPGINLVKQQLRKIGDIAPNTQPIEFARALIIMEGDPVPVAFRGIPGIKVDQRGIAKSGYTDGWCQTNWSETSGKAVGPTSRASAPWGNSWGECWDNSTKKPVGGSMLVVSTPVTGVKAFALDEFTPRELEGLARFDAGR